MILLERLKQGTLHVDFKTSTFYTTIRGLVTIKKTPIVPFGGGRSRKRYLFIRVWLNHQRKAYPLHKAIWIAKHKRDVPKDYDVHHKDLDHTNNHISNLELLHYKKNRSTNNGHSHGSTTRTADDFDD